MIPPLPPARDGGRDGGTAELLPRYEDVTQDGRVQLTSLMPGLGAAVWHALISRMSALDTFRKEGILPILRRLVIVGEDRPASVSVPIRYDGSLRFAREKGGDRLFVNMWVEARAPLASTHGPDPEPGAPAELVGRIFAEHVLTKPFAPPAERKVTRIDAPGLPAIPEDEHPWEPGESLIEGAPLGPAGEVTFGLMHTDSNQHVNSLVYPQIFEEAIVRKLAAEGRPGSERLLVRALELRWRKPFFAGERARIDARIDEAPAGSRFALGASGSFSTAAGGAGDQKPHSTIRVWLA